MTLQCNKSATLHAVIASHLIFMN